MLILDTNCLLPNQTNWKRNQSEMTVSNACMHASLNKINLTALRTLQMFPRIGSNWTDTRQNKSLSLQNRH